MSKRSRKRSRARVRNGKHQQNLVPTAPAIRTQLAESEANRQLADPTKFKVSSHAVSGHSRTIYDLAAHPAKSQFLTACRDRTAMLWDTSSGACLMVYRGHTDYVWRVYIEKSGKFALTISRDKTAKRWLVDTGECVQTCDAGVSLSCGDLHADPGLVATGDDDGFITLWNWDGGRRDRFQAHTGKVSAVAFSEDGRFVFTSGEDGLVKYWKIGQESPVREYWHGDGPVNDVCVSRDGKTLYTAGDDCLIRQWNVETGIQSVAFEGHVGPVTRLELNSRDNELLSTSRDSTVRLWDCDKTICLTTHLYSDGWSWGHLAVVDDGRAILINHGRALLLLDSTTGECLHAYPTARSVKTIGWSQSAGLCAFLDYKERLLVWDRKKNEIISTIDYGNYIHQICFHPSGTSFVTASTDGTARIWDVEKARHTLILKHGEGAMKDGLGVNAAIFTANGIYVVTGCRGGRNNLGVWDSANGEFLKSLRGHKDTVFSLASSRSASKLVSGGGDGAVFVWKTNGPPSDWSCEWQFNIKDGWAERVAISDDGGLVAVCSRAGRVQVGDCYSRAIVFGFDIGEKCTADLSFDGTGTILYVSSRTGTHFAWCLTTNRKIRQFTYSDHSKPNSIAFDTRAGEILHGTSHSVVSTRDTASATGTPYQARNLIHPGICCLAVNRRQDTVAIGMYLRGLAFLNLKSGLPDVRIEGDSTGRKLQFGPSGILGAAMDSAIPYIFQPPYKNTYGGYNGHTASCDAIEMMPSSASFFSASRDGTIRMWDRPSCQSVRTLKGHKGAVLALSYDPANGEALYSAGEDGTVRQWKVGAGDGCRVFQAHKSPVRAVAALPLSSQVVSGSEDGEIIVWNVSTGDAVQTVREHDDTIRDFAVSKDGKWLASASDDRCLRLWQIDRGRISLEHTFRVHDCKVTGCEFVPGSDLLISCGWDGTARFMSLSRRELLATCYVLPEGYLWTTPPDAFAPCGWLHTDRLDRVDLISRDLDGRNPEVVTDMTERRQYFRRYHDASMVMKRIHDHDKYRKELENRLKLQVEQRAEHDQIRHVALKQIGPRPHDI